MSLVQSRNLTHASTAVSSCACFDTNFNTKSPTYTHTECAERIIAARTYSGGLIVRRCLSRHETHLRQQPPTVVLSKTQDSATPAHISTLEAVRHLSSDVSNPSANPGCYPRKERPLLRALSDCSDYHDYPQEKEGFLD